MTDQTTTPTDNTGNQYLAIKDWHKLQPRLVEGRPQTWLRDYADLDNEPEYSKLTTSQRYLLDGCKRLRARYGRNLNNDHTWIIRALSVIPTERGRMSYNIQT